jgi:DNA polymerase V
MKTEAYNADIANPEKSAASNNTLKEIALNEHLLQETFDINDHLNTNCEDTFLMRAKGQSMTNSGISDGDILIVDKAKPLTNNQIVIANMNGELAVKRICKHDGKLYLIPDNADYRRVEITNSTNFNICGVVTFVIHKY